MTVEYVHFLDSDDWFDLLCIEKCLVSALKNQADVVWHNHRIFNELTEEKLQNDFLENLFKNNEILSGLEILYRIPGIFFWAPKGLIATEKLKNIRFEEGIFFEDSLFGIQLFVILKRVVILHEHLMNYRMRKNSISQHTLKNPDDKNNVSFAPLNEDLVGSFCDDREMQQYIFCYASAVTSVRLIDFMQKGNFSQQVNKKLIEMIEEHVFFAFGALAFKSDPRNVREICHKLKGFTRKVTIGGKMAYYFPRIYQLLKWLRLKFKM